MPYTLQQAREKQDEAKKLADHATDPSARRTHMNDVMFWNGYIGAMIDHDYPPMRRALCGHDLTGPIAPGVMIPPENYDLDS